MRFQTYGSYGTPFPTQSTVLTNVLPTQFETKDTSLHWDTLQGTSGESGIIVEGGSQEKTIRLERLFVGWGGLEIAGRMEVRASADKPLCVLFQTAPSGFLAVPIESVISIGDYGLRCANNSVEGEFAVTAYYYVEVP